MVDLTGKKLPTALKAASKWLRLGESQIPALVIHPDWNSAKAVPIVIWMHGRTVDKETDPGRYLRLMRSGIGVCAVDLPGHGERFDERMQKPDHVYDIIIQMIDEIDEIIDAIRDWPLFDEKRMGIGGMSGGGMATLGRLCHEHPFVCSSVEATTGSWADQSRRPMFLYRSLEEINETNPIKHLDAWREIPFQAFHAIHDEWVGLAGQKKFIGKLQARYTDPELIDFQTYERTGAPNEHAGFGRYSGDVKNRQTEFFRKWLQGEA